MLLEELVKDKWAVGAVCNARGTCELLDFLETLPANMEAHKNRLINILEQVAENGPQHFKDNISHRADSKHNIWEFRAGRIRVYWFYDSGRIIVCSHGIVKKSNTTASSDKKKARAAQIAYQEDKSNNTWR